MKAGWEFGGKSLAAQTEKSIKGLLTKLDKDKFFTFAEPVEKEKANINGKLFEKKPVEKEVDPDVLEDILDES